VGALRLESERFRQPGQVVRQGRFDPDRPSSHRVLESERLRVQCLALERNVEWRSTPWAIHGFTDYGMANLGQVNADLMRASRFEPASEPGSRAAESLNHFIMSDGADAPVGSADYASAAVAPVSDKGQVDRSPRGFNQSLDKRAIKPFDGMSAEECLERSKRPGRTNDEYRAGRVSVETVDDANVMPGRPARACKVSPRALQQGTAFACGRRLSQHSGGLVNDEDMTVLIKYLQSAWRSLCAWAIRPER
jgi:hypothetical protein